MIKDLQDAIAHAKEVVEEKRKLYEQACAYNLPSEGFCECASEHEQLVAWLEELVERREADRWIPVSEKLPNTSGVYYVAKKTTEGETVYVIPTACYFDGQNTWHDDNRVNHSRPYPDVIAWKPRPEI